MTSLLIQFQLRRIINLHTILLTGSALFQMRMNKGTYLLQMGNVIVNMCNVKLLAPEKLYEPNTLNQGNGSLKTKKHLFQVHWFYVLGGLGLGLGLSLSLFFSSLWVFHQKRIVAYLQIIFVRMLNQSTAQTKVPSVYHLCFYTCFNIPISKLFHYPRWFCFLKKRNIP